MCARTYLKDIHYRRAKNCNQCESLTVRAVKSTKYTFKNNLFLKYFITWRNVHDEKWGKTAFNTFNTECSVQSDF